MPAESPAPDSQVDADPALGRGSTIGSWLADQRGTPLMDVLARAMGTDRSVLTPAQALPLEALVAMSGGRVTDALVDHLVSAASTGSVPELREVRGLMGEPAVAEFDGTAHLDADGLVRVYAPASPSGAGLVWMHGGGFEYGSLDMPEADAVARALADRGVAVFSVDYRLVGDGCRYPAPSDDVLRAWEWTRTNAARFDVDATRLFVGGASAGGNLAAGAVLRLIDRGAALPAGVVLAYPTLMAEQPPPSSELRRALDANPEADVFGPDAVSRMYAAFVGDGASMPMPASPADAPDDVLRAFPSTLIVLGDTDELRISGEVFAERLGEAGVQVRTELSRSSFHGFLNDPDGPWFAPAIELIADVVTATGGEADVRA